MSILKKKQNCYKISLGMLINIKNDYFCYLDCNFADLFDPNYRLLFNTKTFNKNLFD